MHAIRFLGSVAVIGLLSLLLPRLGAAPPVNDQYSNRIAIVSSSLVVTTSLAEATGDYYPPEWVELRWDWLRGSNSTVSPPVGTLWWTVTLTNPSSLTVEMLEGGSFCCDYWRDHLAVWKHDMVPVNDHSERQGNLWTLPSVEAKSYVTASLTNGGPLNLDVQLSGFTGNVSQVVLRFTIHTVPLILIPPQSRTVSPGESVFFGVAATGHSHPQYQWLHNEQPLTGETFPMLSIEHVTAAHAGTYRVLVMDDLGTNSADATLTVSETNVPPRWVNLERLSSNEWKGRLDVEAGRSYRMEFSGSLTNWAPLTRLVQDSSIRFGTAGAVSNSGVVFLANANSEIRFKSQSAQQFLRAARYEATNSECHNNLKKFRFAKELWRIENKKVASHTPMDSDLVPYARNYKFQCPEHGVYTLNYGFSQPECSVHSPLLEPSW